MENEDGIIIFDGTPVDTLAFIELFTKDKKVYSSLSPQVTKVMEHFDLIYLIERADNDYSKNTTLLTGDQRKEINEFIKNIIQTLIHGMKK
ncbi:MAG: hypothetical protein HY064_10325 [Bacteroidetes bacterium]|nr:hypothetical protein [Bacteroidota bacterium]